VVALMDKKAINDANLRQRRISMANPRLAKKVIDARAAAQDKKKKEK
jgi:hypothetical protein